MTFLLQSDVSLGDNRVLDQWRIPFGDWYEQAVFWIDNNMKGPLDAINAVFEFLITVVNDYLLLGPPWYIIVLAFFVLGWVLQNVRVGLFAAGALIVCALMGTDYWAETVKTIGFIFVAVLLCVVIGIPIGIMCGRVDSVWRAVRPVLDAMQVVHSFVYMLPMIFFFGIGEVGATIVTMVFALPPLIRLTNLGIRQVPEDVVEASRAFGQTELAILRDVQMPLARPAIMTGINQTLLLSISMLGIAALMGAGGLAKFMLRAINSQDSALSGSSGLSFFLVAVMLDRLSQRDGDTTKSLGARLQRAWANRATPEALLPTPEEIQDSLPVTASSVIEYEPVKSQERLGILLTAAGSVVVLVSLFLTWNSNGGWFSSFTRRADELGAAPALGARDAIDLSGQSFNGLQASGASWFGYMLALLAIGAIYTAVSVLRKPGETSRWLNADGGLVLAIATFVVALTYLLSSPSEFSVAESGPGQLIALIGSAIMLGGGILWIISAKHEPLRPLPTQGVAAPVVIAAISLALLLLAGVSNFTSDERTEAVITPELQAELDELNEEADRLRAIGVDPDSTAEEKSDAQRSSVALINEMQSLRASAVQDETITINGFTGNGSQMARWTLVAGVVGFIATVISAGFVFKDANRRWIAGATAMGLGAGCMAVAIGWIGTTARATDPNIVSGVGILFLLMAGATLANAGRTIINDFRRSRVYPEIVDTRNDRRSVSDSKSQSDTIDRAVVGAAGN